MINLRKSGRNSESFYEDNGERVEKSEEQTNVRKTREELNY